MPLIHKLINNVVHCGVTPKNKCRVSVQTISIYLGYLGDICTADDIACLNRPNQQVAPGKWPKITIMFVSFITNVVHNNYL